MSEGHCNSWAILSDGVMSPRVLSRSCVERVGGLVEIILAVSGEVGAFREVLAYQPVGVLVRSSLPRRFRVTEIQLDTGINSELGVLSHLFALIPM